MIKTGKLWALSLLAATAITTQARADIITFDGEGLSGPSYASETSAGTVDVSTSIGTVSFSNGAVLTNESSLPADETSVFYNSFFLSGSTGDTVTITFPTNITNFFLDLYNGETYPDTFTVADNTGVSNTVTIDSNSAGGNALISFPAVGDVVTLTTPDTSGYDFSIDNIGFDQATPSPVPLPGALPMFGAALLGLGGLGMRKSRRAITS